METQGGIQALERWRFPATEAGPPGSQERRGETHTEEQRPTDRDKSWEERDQREAGRGVNQGAGDQHTLRVPRNILLLQNTPFCSLGCSETSLMQAAWLLGARGSEREWEGGWGGAQEEEREREALMLKVSWRLLGL